MSGAAPALIIGGIVVPTLAALDVRQTYQWFGGRSVRRTMDGTPIEQWSYRKLRTEISGAGWVPPGLDEVQGIVTIDCMARRTVGSTSNVIVLPTAYRPDVAPVGYALVGGSLVETPVMMASLTATLTVVGGASGYQVHYFPRLTALADPLQTDDDIANAELRWSITAEQQ